MRTHLATFLADFQRNGRDIFVVTYPGNRRVRTSYGELAVFAGRFSRLLSERGIRPGERVLLWGANSAEWVAAFFGCVLRGVVAVPLDAAGGHDFAVRVVEDVSPKLAIGDRNLLEKLSDTVSKIFFEDFASVLPSQPQLDPEPSLGLESQLQILYTSGTTSAPRGIVHTHGNVLASINVLEPEFAKYQRYIHWVHPVRILETLPLSHVFGQFMGIWVPALLAGETHFEDVLVACHLVERIRRQRISAAAVVPRVLELIRAHLLAEIPDLPKRIAAVRHRRFWWKWWYLLDVHRRFGLKMWGFVSGGASLPDEVERFWNDIGFLLVQGYGMTETTALATLNHPFHPTQGVVGKPLAGREVRIAEDGEILVRGATLAAGTWRDGRMEERGDEWLHTGDLGSIDEAGNVHFLGRKSDVIVAASGMNIHPSDLEEALREQSGVRDSMVVGWEGPRGAEPVAVLILEGNAGEEGHRNLDDILAGANSRLAEFQQIRTALRWPEGDFPRNSVGKSLRREVTAWVDRQLKQKSPGAGQRTDREVASSSNTDRLLGLLEQVTGESAAGLDDAADLGTRAGLDSLGRMQLAMGIEERFGVSVDDDSIANAKTVGDLRKLLGAAGTVSSAGASVKASPESIPAAAPRGVQHEPEKIAAPEQDHAGEPSISTRPRLTEEDRGQVGSPRAARLGLLSPVSMLVRSFFGSRDRHAPKYTRWPWSAPAQAVRAAFIEAILRPLVYLLAKPKIQCDAAALPHQPSIYISNHLTAVDVAMVLYALPGRVRRRMAVAMSAEMLMAWRYARDAGGVGPGPLRWLAPLQAQLVVVLLNVFPLPAGSGLRRSFAHAGEALDRGYNVLVFPEGRRSKDGQLQPFQTGISLLARESGTDVVPIGIAGLWEASQHSFPRNFRPAGLAVSVGMPLRQGREESHIGFSTRLRDAVRHLIAVGGEPKRL
jgi:long-chain acyl-CoA synthetase